LVVLPWGQGRLLVLGLLLVLLVLLQGLQELLLPRELPEPSGSTQLHSTHPAQQAGRRTRTRLGNMCLLHGLARRIQA
jgi:hypothetical protein